MLPGNSGWALLPFFRILKVFICAAQKCEALARFSEC